MLCPRCHRARIERNGMTVRCAVCGISYDPNQKDPTAQAGQSAAASHWLPNRSFLLQSETVFH